MDGARRKFLAAARRADDEDAAVGRRHLLDGLAQLIAQANGRRARSRRCELLELLHLALEPGILERAFGNEQQPVGLEGLFDEVVGAALDGRYGGLDIAVAGDHDDRHFGMFALERVEQLQAVEPASLQPDVEKDEVGPAGDDRRQRLVAVGAVRVS